MPGQIKSAIRANVTLIRVRNGVSKHKTFRGACLMGGCLLSPVDVVKHAPQPPLRLLASSAAGVRGCMKTCSAKELRRCSQAR